MHFESGPDEPGLTGAVGAGALQRDAQQHPSLTLHRGAVVEVSVLRMMSAPLGRHAQQGLDAATRVLYAVGDSAAVGQTVSDVEALTSRLWRVANGEEDAAEAGTGTG